MTEDRGWQRVRRALSILPKCTNAGFVLKSQYQRYFSGFELDFCTDCTTDTQSDKNFNDSQSKSKDIIEGGHQSTACQNVIETLEIPLSILLGKHDLQRQDGIL